MEDRRELLDDDFGSAGPEKTRHGCVTAWLSLMIAVNAIAALAYLLGGNLIQEALPNGEIEEWTVSVLAVLGIANVIFAVMLFQWKKLGFYGFVATSLASIGINLSIGMGLGQSLLGLVGIAILYAILQIREHDLTAWEQLE
jgi:hypothetical protein